MNGTAKNKLSKGARVALILCATIIFLLCAVAGVAYWRYIHPTGKVMPDIYAVRTNNGRLPMGNFFLVEAEDKYIAIDAGADNSQTEKGLKKLKISADDVVAVFITHSDWDHIGSLDMFNKATIYTGNTEGSSFPVGTPHAIMKDNESIEVSGRTVKCFYTPGHKIDSVCFLVDGKYLFVGDLFVSENMPNTYDAELMRSYQKKMLQVEGVEYIFNGHYGLHKKAEHFRRKYL